MLLDDSIEFECNDSSANSEPLPVNWDLDLTKIWIPSSVLPNRKKQINLNENKPFILYSLEKPDYSKTVSIYSDECPQYDESQTPSAVLSRVSHHKLIVNSNNKLEIQEILLSSPNAVELGAKLVHPDHSLRDCQETRDFMVRNATQWEEEVINISTQEASYRASLEDLTRRMAEILSEDEPLKENWYHEDVIKTDQLKTGSTFDSIPLSIKDSLEELYYSDNDENLFTVKDELYNLELESPEKKPINNIYIENSYVREQTSEGFENGLEQAKNNTDPKCFEKTEEIQFENQEVSVDNIFSQSEHRELNEIEFVVHTKDYELELLNNAEESEDSIEKVPEFPIAYKRPPLQEQINKTKPQKGKKKTKKPKKNITLEDFFESEEVDRFKVPEVDEFYENLVRQGKCKPLNEEINTNGFPCLNLTEELQTYVKFPSINLSDQSQNVCWDAAQKFRGNLCSEPQSKSLNENIRNEEKTEQEFESEDSLDTLVIDNIPLNVSKESIENFISGYGELKNLTIEQFEKFQRVKLQMDFMCEVDWIIDCLNGSQPFGSSSKELIKCYRQA